jgi:hypothetical protein
MRTALAFCIQYYTSFFAAKGLLTRAAHRFNSEHVQNAPSAQVDGSAIKWHVNMQCHQRDEKFLFQYGQKIGAACKYNILFNHWGQLSKAVGLFE